MLRPSLHIEQLRRVHDGHARPLVRKQLHSDTSPARKPHHKAGCTLAAGLCPRGHKPTPTSVRTEGVDLYLRVHPLRPRFPRPRGHQSVLQHLARKPPSEDNDHVRDVTRRVPHMSLYRRGHG